MGGTAATTGGTGAQAGGGGYAGTSAAGGTAPFSVCNEAAASSAVTVYVIGDSTASVYASDLYPRMGWGQVFGDYFNPACAVVDDRALSGRSSKSFFDEGAWMPIESALRPGDWVLIQFAHNDEKSEDPTRYTEPSTTFKQHLTTYIEDTRAKQAHPLLLTPIQRNQWNGATMSETHGAYPAAMRELAEELDVLLVDATNLTKAHFEQMGQATTTNLFMNLSAGEFPNYPDGNSDNTHLRESGARVVAELIIADAYRQQLPLAQYLAEVPVAP